MLAPEERDVGEGRALADDGARDRLALPLGNHPVLDAHEAATTRVWPARGVADGEDPLGCCLQVRVYDNSLLDPQSCLLREAVTGLTPMPATINSASSRSPPPRTTPPRATPRPCLAEVEDDTVPLVEVADEVIELRTQHALERAPIGRDVVHLDLPRTERRRGFEPNEARPENDRAPYPLGRLFSDSCQRSRNPCLDHRQTVDADASSHGGET